MKINNARIYTESQRFQDGEIYIKDGIFSDKADGRVIDAKGCYAIPGLIDLHLHGCMGYDFCDGTITAIEKMTEYEISRGITGIVPATMTLPADKLEQILAIGAEYNKAAQAADKKKRADLLGINMEGPFISEKKRGAQDARYILPCDTKLGERFLKASEGLVKFIGIAPEENPDFQEFIRFMKDKVTISLAHTNASYTDALAAFQEGASYAVHLFNAMPMFHHREPGVIGAAADSPHVCAELICDGIHLHPSMVRAAINMFGSDRIVFVSDSMRAAGMADGRYMLGGLEVEVKGKKAVLVSDGALAGSVATLADCVRTAVKEMGIPLETAVACAAVNPAKRLGLYQSRGSIQTGKKADMVLLDQELQIQMVIKDGEVVFEEKL